MINRSFRRSNERYCGPNRGRIQAIF